MKLPLAMDIRPNLLAFPRQPGALPPLEFAGKTLRPLSYGSYCLLLRKGNLLIQQLAARQPGQDLALTCDDERGLFALLAFVYVHAAPVAEATAATLGSAQEFELAVLTFAQTFELDTFTPIAEFSAHHIRAVHSFEQQNSVAGSVV